MTDIEVEPLAATDYDPPLWLQAITYPAGTDRDLIDATFSAVGVIGAGDFLVGPRGAGANMSVDVAAGKIVVPGTDVSGQGKYIGRLKNTVNVPISAAPSAGLTRIDRIVAHVVDATVIGGTTNAMTVETPVVGTPASSNPVPPTIPPSSLLLADITIASGTASIIVGLITDRRVRATATNPGPYVLGGEIQGGTDAFGNFNMFPVPGIPANGKVISAVAIGSQANFPNIVVRNNTDTPAGGPNATFRIFNNAGQGLGSTVVAIAYVVVWSY